MACATWGCSRRRLEPAFTFTTSGFLVSGSFIRTSLCCGSSETTTPAIVRKVPDTTSSAFIVLPSRGDPAETSFGLRGYYHLGTRIRFKRQQASADIQLGDRAQCSVRGSRLGEKRG